jgi:hypothetical protein
MTPVDTIRAHATNTSADPEVSFRSRDPMAAIDELWFSAMAGGFHGAFCNCFGGAPVTLNAASLEADVVDYLLPRYTAERLDPLADGLKRRRIKPVGSFVDWLRGQDAVIAPDLYDRLTDDVAGILTSIGSAATGFACT